MGCDITDWVLSITQKKENIIMKKIKYIALIMSLALMSCAKDTPNVIAKVAAIETSDQCHLCGMIITNFAGPKGELAIKGENKVVKFCSTKDLFAYFLQPENKHRTVALYVHDMSKSPWETPDDDHFIAAKDAYFVWGSSRKGGMGSTLASFSDLSTAELFTKEYGGKVIGFNEITLELLNSDMIMANDLNSAMESTYLTMDHKNP